MNNAMLDYLSHKVNAKRHSMEDMRSRDSRDYRGNNDSRDYRDNRYEDSRDRRDYKGSGTVDFEGSMDFQDGNRGGSDYRYSDSRDYRDMRDMRDYGRTPRLSKTDVHHWKQMMRNEDGTKGPHYDMQQLMEAAEKANVHFKDFDEREFCMAVNMMYSDYCKVAKKYIAPDKELSFFVEMAKAFLEDEDGPEASEKLALYFHCIVDA